ncbi:MAG: hypothetical protein HYU05_02090, partial [Candidatus Wildermuthbacteria bacterium]|nr:hypothetical protein [Candidatus Wildermuthbacteria bacterium]
RNLAVSLSRVLLLSPLILGVSSVFSGVLQYFQKFLLYAIAPVLYNLGIIGGILFFAPAVGIRGVVIGVLAGAFLHMAVQAPGVVKQGFRWRLEASLSHPALRKIGLLALPRLFSVSAQQLMLVVLTSLASFFAPGSIAIFQFANNIQYLPVGVLGLSFSLASFPSLARAAVHGSNGEFLGIFSRVTRHSLARAAVHGSNGEFLGIFSRVTRQIVLMTGVASIGIFFFRNDIVRLLLQSGSFSPQDVRLTGAALGLFSFGIVLHALLLLFVRAFFALQDTKTPAYVHGATLVVNILLALGFSRMLASPGPLYDLLAARFSLEGVADIRVLALPLSLTITAGIQCALLGMFLQKRFTHGTDS